MHWFLDPVTKHYADFTGRASRQQYWMFVLVYVLVSIVVSLVGEMIGGADVASALLSLALFLPSLAIGARRLHDIGRSGWWLLLSFIPIVGWIVLIIFHIQKGDAGPNQYGSPVASMEIPTAPAKDATDAGVPEAAVGTVDER